jgi:hypothetical protein
MAKLMSHSQLSGGGEVVIHVPYVPETVFISVSCSDFL